MPFISALNGSIGIKNSSSITDYDWAITTDIDAPNPVIINGEYTISSPTSDSNKHPQLSEGDSLNWTVTTTAPHGTQVYVTTQYVGTTHPADATNLNGWRTVQNGTITGSLRAFADSEVETDLQMVQISVRVNQDYQSTQLVESQYINIVDATSWTAPSSGEVVQGGEYVTNDGVTHSQWRNTTDSTTGNPQIYIRINTTINTVERQDVQYVLENLSVSDPFVIDQPTAISTAMTITGNISSYLDTNPDFKVFLFDVNQSTTNSVYFYLFTLTAP